VRAAGPMAKLSIERHMESVMRVRIVSAAAVSAAALLLVVSSHAQTAAQDAAQYAPAKYPDWSGQWRRPGAGPNKYDPTKPPGLPQDAPLTPEYLAIFKAGLADQAAGGQGTALTYSCLPPGMPRVMAGNQGLEFVVTPKTTHVIFVNARSRRIYTDGRDFPKDEDPTFSGYSIGKWSDTDGDGKYDTLEVETRNLDGPRTIDNAGIPLHADNETIVKERIYRDKSNPDILHNEMTTIDHAFTHPWSVHKTYQLQKKPNWVENECSVGNQHVMIGKEGYYLSAEGYLMPVKKGQPPPDLRYFEQSRK
jgi:hypothetical protein